MLGYAKGKSLSRSVGKACSKWATYHSTPHKRSLWYSLKKRCSVSKKKKNLWFSVTKTRISTYQLINTKFWGVKFEDINFLIQWFNSKLKERSRKSFSLTIWSVSTNQEIAQKQQPHWQRSWLPGARALTYYDLEAAEGTGSGVVEGQGPGRSAVSLILGLETWTTDLWWPRPWGQCWEACCRVPGPVLPSGSSQPSWHWTHDLTAVIWEITSPLSISLDGTNHKCCGGSEWIYHK